MIHVKVLPGVIDGRDDNGAFGGHRFVHFIHRDVTGDPVETVPFGGYLMRKDPIEGNDY